MCIYFACSGFLPSNFSIFYKIINGKVSKITLDFCLIMIFVITLVWFHDLYPACFFLFIFFRILFLVLRALKEAFCVYGVCEHKYHISTFKNNET